MKTKTIFLTVILLLLSIGVFAQKDPEPSSVVRKFYRLHLTRSGIFSASEVSWYKKWFSDDLNKLFDNELKREKEFLKQNPTDKPHFGDGFPFQPLDECAPDGKAVQNTYQVGAAAIEGSKARVEVKFYNPKACGGELIDTYKVELLVDKGFWLINDWLYSDGRKLSEDLKRADY